MNYEAKNFEHLFGLAGFSDELLKNHFTLYGGYVTNTNKVYEALKTTEVGTPQWSELKRRFGWEWNGMRLHELYFENMKLDGSSLGDGELKKVMDDCREVSEEKPFGPSGTFNDFKFNEPVTTLIDYIFISKNSTMKVKKYAVLSDSKDLKYPSDHLPVYVEIQFQQ